MFDQLGIKAPIWCAGMGGGITGPELAAAVSEAGGLGVLGLGGGLPEPIMAEQIADLRTRTSKAFGANLILPLLAGREAETCFEARIPVLVTFWGDPAPYVRDAHQRDMKVVSQCGNVEEAVAAADAGVDAIIIQGTQAGGHVKAEHPLEETLAACVGELGATPVIAAGGIATGKQIAKALQAGAAAVSMGTRFLATIEANAVDAYKDRIVKARASDTVLTELFDVGWPAATHRVIKNGTFEAWEAAGQPAPGERPGEGTVVGHIHVGDASLDLLKYTVMPPAANVEGSLDELALYAGESCESINDIPSVKNLMDTLMAETRAALR
jgi:nitronate monooxygenase/enoyl-[acyl-carrier protein] reductase II